MNNSFPMEPRRNPILVPPGPLELPPKPKISSYTTRRCSPGPEGLAIAVPIFDRVDREFFS